MGEWCTYATKGWKVMNWHWAEKSVDLQIYSIETTNYLFTNFGINIIQ